MKMLITLLIALGIASLSTPSASATIATAYPHDVGIGSDPAVVFSEDFESSLATFSARFNGGGPSGIATSTDHATISGGVQSVRLIPASINGTLYRQLPSDYTTLYLRYYVKYVGSNSHHAGGYVGGYYPANSFPQGDAGLKGCRDNPCLSGSDRLFIASFEQRGGNGSSVPMTHIGTYNQWIDMPCAAGPFNCFGRDMLITENQSLDVNNWQCVEIGVTVNSTTSSHDGSLSIWSNDTLVQSFTNGTPTGAYNGSEDWVTGAGSPFAGMQWRDALTYGVNWIKVQNYSDGGTAYDVYYDDLVAATSRIGCIASGATLPGVFRLEGLAKTR